MTLSHPGFVVVYKKVLSVKVHNMHLLPMSEIMMTLSTLALLCVCFMGVWSRDEPTVSRKLKFENV